jgi:hypothetical protein
VRVVTLGVAGQKPGDRQHRRDDEPQQPEIQVQRPRRISHQGSAGEELLFVLGALNSWGDRFRPAPAGTAAHYIEAETGEPVELRFVTAEGRLVQTEQVQVVRHSPVETSQEMSAAH